MNWEVSLQVGVGRLSLDVSLAGNGRPVALIGPNGSGKTTILRTIAGARQPRSGRIRIGERVLFDSLDGVDLPPEERGVGYVPQGFGLFPHLRALDNVAFGTGRTGTRMPREARRVAAVALLAQLGCRELADRWPTSLSGGEQQKVALARALSIEPGILLLDEPLSAMDAGARRSLRSYLAEHLKSRSAPAIVVTQDARDVAALDATVFVLEGGRIVQKGEADELGARPATPFVAEFFGSDIPVSRDPDATS